MIIVSINGGLGNQLFQYAFGKHLEHLHGEEVLFDLSAFDNPEHRPFALHHFSVTIKEASQNELPFIFRKNFKNFRLISKLLDKTLYPCRLITQKQFNFDAYYLEKIKNAHYWGSWQSEQYFSGVKGTIKNNFTFKKSDFSALEKNIYQQINSSNAICLHVRRGDYVGSKLHCVCDISYYQQAIKLIAEKIENPHFFIFSDDILWCKNNASSIGWQHEFINTGEAWRDFRLMSYCKHFIIANSSFSWWAAYLGKHEEKIVISPSKWFTKDYKYDITNLKPSNWISI